MLLTSTQIVWPFPEHRRTFCDFGFKSLKQDS